MRTDRLINILLFGLLGGIILLLASCIDVFQPEIDEFQDVLVVDGEITNMPGPYTVKLSFSSSVYDIEEKFIEDATVTIIEENGPEEVLSGGEKGVYTTSENGIQGIEGKQYKIRVEAADGNIYESPFQLLNKATPIESVEPVVEYKFLSEEEGEVPGYQFYVNTALSENEQDYFLWIQQGTYKYKSDYTLDYFWIGELVENPDPTGLMTCYKTYTLDEVHTYNTANLVQNKIENLPLAFVRADDRLINIRYSLLVKQYSLTREAYNFWNNIEGQIESLGSLYASQPFQIRGNISNINDPDEIVHGHFLVAGLSEKRIFVDPPPGLNIELAKCFLDFMGYGFVRYTPQNLWPVYIHETDSGSRALSDPGCIDCTENGGAVEVPEFWEE